MKAISKAPLITTELLMQAAMAGTLAASLAVLVVAPWLDGHGLWFPAMSPAQAPLINFPYGIGLLYWVHAVWQFIKRRRQGGGQAQVIFNCTAAVAIGLFADLVSEQRFLALEWLSWLLAGGGLVALAYLEPTQDQAVAAHPWRAWLGCILAVLIFAIIAMGMNIIGENLDRSALTAIVGASGGASFLFYAVWMTNRLRNAPFYEREAIRLLLLAVLLSFGPILLWGVGYFALGGRLAFTPALILPMTLVPFFGGYVLLRSRQMQLDFIFSRAALYSTLAVVTTAGYALLSAGVGLLVSLATTHLSAWLQGLIFFLLALGILPLRQSLQNHLDRFFFRGRLAYQERLQTFSGEMTHQVELPAILQTLRATVTSSLTPIRLHIFIYDPLGNQYLAAPDHTGRPTSDLRFAKSSPLVSFLETQHFPIVLEAGSALPPAVQNEQARLRILNALCFAPLGAGQRMAGWLALDARRSGEPYSQRERSFLDAICDQASLAIERAQVVMRLEARVRETNALARVAQGVNITLTLDDTLELIYAQTTQVIAADEFHVMLKKRGDDTLSEVFCVVNEDRLTERENLPAPDGSPLENEVIRQRRSILSDDYNRECQKRGILSSRSQLFGWMCVPLNAGAQTIGTISLGKHDPTLRYTREQLELLQAIGDQVAGAIVKVQLLQETERRAHQLSSLNEVTRQLTSTLELEPLLNNILQSGVDILNCEAGSLLLVDEHSGDLVFRAASGPVAASLLHTRLPAGAGLAGKSVYERSPLIVNNVHETQGWFRQTDQKTGFITHSILVVPLIVKNQVTGVLEVINKRDSSPFQLEDQELLSTFAGQAAVAVENARQFTMTDRALAARVDELSAMQRLDRELNTSLDVVTTMRITLEWALRQGDGDAGLIGLVEDDGIHIMHSQGYGSELQTFENHLLPSAATALESVILSGVAQRQTVNGPQGSPRGILAGAANQVLLPIRRETRTIGLMLIESLPGKPISDETLDFLSRLCDHAAVAISNAQLYATIQAANIAKSEFVSFVSHELKNPMTSIKGYTELLAAGVVGQVNEAQANFLATIRSNIERMNTLISDLNDVSKIEARRLRLDFKSQPLGGVVEEIVRSTRRQLEEKNQQLTVQLPTALPEVWADHTRLAQILVNLVSNANKYTPAGGQINVAAEACPNQWDASGAPQVVHIWVQDSGIGISADDQKKIFQKFFRSEDTKAREAPGTGLGLNITKSLVEMQGGRIWFESEFRQGTTFHFTVPVAG